MRYWLALNQLMCLGVKEVAYFLRVFDELEDIFKAGSAELRQIGFTDELVAQIASVDWKGVDKALTWAEHPRHHVLPFNHACYPRLLRELKRPPIVLFVDGDPICLSQPQLAMVGSRNATPMGKETAEAFAQALTQAGLTITSGLARGIDAASHRGALKVGQTVAVLGTGIDRVYPVQHVELARRIAERGALVSEFPVGTEPKAMHFPIRNRIISGLSLGVFVVEAALRSGSLITAQLAGNQGRDVFAMPGSIHQALSRGCHKLIQEGAQLVETVEDILHPLNMSGPILEAVSTDAENKSFTKLDDDHKKLLSCIGFASTAIDTIMVRTGFSSEQVSSMLLQLELQGYITTALGGYCRNR